MSTSDNLIIQSPDKCYSTGTARHGHRSTPFQSSSQSAYTTSSSTPRRLQQLTRTDGREIGYEARPDGSLRDPLGWGALPSDSRQCMCERAGGKWCKTWSALDYASAWDSANALSIDNGTSAWIGLLCLFIPYRPIQVGVTLGIAANWATAYLLCQTEDCYRDGTPISY